MKVKAAIFLTIFAIGCDYRYTRGADPIKNDGGWCVWYKDSNNDRYCAYSKTIPPKEKLSYAKCNKGEERKIICQD